MFNRKRRSFGASIAAMGVATLMTVVLPNAFATQMYQPVKSGVLTIANGGNYPPMEFSENGKLVGYDIDLGNEIARRMNLKPEFVVVEYRGIIGALKSKRADILLSAMTITPQRAEQVLFTDGYLSSPIAAAVSKINSEMMPADISPETRIGVEIGSAGQSWVRDNVKNGAKVSTYDNIIQAVMALEAGRLDMVVNNVPVLRYLVKETSNLTVTSPWDSRVAAIAVRLEDTALAAQINKILADMKDDGFKDRLDIKWFGSAE